MEKSSSKIRLSKEDKTNFRTLGTIVDGIANVFGSNCEVVLHSLEDSSHSVVKIANSHVTGRKVGSPLTDFLAEILKRADSLEEDVIGCYYNKLDDGRLLKSVSVLLRNTKGKPIGFLCINIDLSAPLLDFLTGFLPMRGESSKNIIEHFPITIKELISRTLEMVIADVSNRREIPPSEKNKLITQELYKRGLFNVKGAIDLVAKEMGVSRYTIYNYIREAKVEIGEVA